MTTIVKVQNRARAGQNQGDWAVMVGERVVSTHRKKRAAISRGRQKARGVSGPAQLRIQDSGGRWRTEATYR